MANEHSGKSVHSASYTLTMLILERVAEVGVGFVGAFFPAKYPEARLWRNLLGCGTSYKFERKTFAAILSRLKAEGLVSVRKEGARALWSITEKGRDRLGRFRRRADIPKRDGVRRLVAFDIPEKERGKRRWLRGELVALEYRQLQKSVWLGETPLPVDFMNDLDVLQLRGKVHIFRIADGTLA